MLENNNSSINILESEAVLKKLLQIGKYLISKEYPLVPNDILIKITGYLLEDEETILKLSLLNKNTFAFFQELPALPNGTRHRKEILAEAYKNYISNNINPIKDKQQQTIEKSSIVAFLDELEKKEIPPFLPALPPAAFILSLLVVLIDAINGDKAGAFLSGNIAAGLLLFTVCVCCSPKLYACLKSIYYDNKKNEAEQAVKDFSPENLFQVKIEECEETPKTVQEDINKVEAVPDEFTSLLPKEDSSSSDEDNNILSIGYGSINHK